MKLLILSCNNGGGHNSVSEALRECYEAHGWDVDICDSLSFISEKASSLISFSHVLIYRHIPTMLDASYKKTEDKHQLFEKGRPSRRFLDLGRHRLGRFVQQGGYDLVISTHVFGAMMLESAEEEYGFHIRSGIIETDYCNTPGCVMNRADFHFIPHESLVPELISFGVPEEAIVVSGIPVRQKLVDRIEKTKAKKLFGLSDEKPHVLLMGGSMGCGPIPELLALLDRKYRDDADISVVCGTNSSMEGKLRDQYAGKNNIHIFGYMPDMSKLYAGADLFVTKPGGICTTEAAVIGLPMVLANVVAGAEEFNLRFFTQHEAALSGNDEFELAAACAELIEQKERREAAAEHLRTLVKRNSAEIIYQTFEQKGL